MSWIIYALKDGEEIVYVGATSRPLHKRLLEHRSRKKIPLHFIIEKICIAKNRQEAERKEEHLINLIGVHRLLNKQASQRSTTLGRKKSPESVEKTRIALKGRANTWSKKWTLERRINSINAMTGVKKRTGSANERLVRMGHREFDLYKDGKLIGRFINQTHAAKSLNMAKSTFVNIFKGLRMDNKGIEVKYVP